MWFRGVDASLSYPSKKLSNGASSLKKVSIINRAEAEAGDEAALRNNGDSTQQLLCMEEKAFKSVRQSQKPCQQCSDVSRISPEISIAWIQMAEC